MNKFTIKVIKRDKVREKNVLTTRESILGSAKLERLHKREAIRVVNDWIAESRENSRLERLLSDETISVWRAATSKPNGRLV